MAWTTPITVVTGDVIPASWGNTYVRDNTAWLRGMLDGTGSGTVKVPSDLQIANDVNFDLGIVSSNPTIAFDSGGDYIYYDRALNAWGFFVGNVNKLVIDNGGKLTGAGFYDTGAGGVSMVTGATTNFAHGLGVQPRFIFGYFGNPTIASTVAVTNIAGVTVRVTAADATNITVNNGLATTTLVRLFAIK